MVTADAVGRWIDAWDRGWRAHDADVVATVYRESAIFLSHPFRAPQGPREYAAWAFADEDRLVDLRWGRPRIDGDRAAVEYWAVVLAGGKESTLAGVALLRFDADGYVVEQRDYWAMQDGRVDPVAGWGR